MNKKNILLIVLTILILTVIICIFNRGGIVDVIKDGENGYLSSDMSVDSYKEALKKIIVENSIDKEVLIQRFEDNYTIKSCANSYLELYKGKVNG